MLTPYQILRPFLWLAAMGFLIGFTGFLLLGRGAFASDAPQFEPGRAAPTLAISDEDLERSNETKTSAVHFLRFELAPEGVADLRAGAPLAFSVAHPHYAARAEVPARVRDALVADLG